MPDLGAALTRLFGFPSFLPGQEEIVGRAVEGRDTLALMPTGSGKSLPYQLAAMLRPEPTLVVSPLIALMKDQLDKLPPAVAARATLVNSSLEPGEAARRVASVRAGDVSLVYAAPERLRHRSFVSALAAAGVGLVVVDEVHCVTMWGHDFRPDYLFIRKALAALGEPVVLGLTATATPATEAEIGRSLGRDFDVVRASVVRPNLRHRVVRAENEEERRVAVLHAVADAAGPAIVYARSRLSCEKLARFLRGHGIGARHYHAGMDAGERAATQDAFLGGEAAAIVATTAFGMGIDKPDIRLVLLANLPGSLEDYVQMVGRAGRDGRPSDCVLLAGASDARSLRRFVEGDVRPVETLRSLYRRVRAGLPVEDEDRVPLGMLEQVGLVARGFDRELELPPPPADAGERIATLLARMRDQARARVDRIVAFADSPRCRQVEIAEHFGEAGTGPCGVCDRCAPSSVLAAATDPPPELPEDVGAAVLAAVRDLRWPLGATSLAAMLAGSVSAPPSARRHPAFGSLGAAGQGAVKRWIGRLVASGHLERYESDDGFPLLRLGPAAGPPPPLTAPRSGPGDAPTLDRLRGWRLARAREDGVPAYVVFHDRTLEALASARPGSADELASVPGIGPAKLERYGAELLDVIAATPG